MFDIIIRCVDRLGFLAIVKDEQGDEVFRGEYKKNPHEALDYAIENASERGLEIPR